MPELICHRFIRKQPVSRTNNIENEASNEILNEQMKNNCDTCVHKAVCKYIEQFQKSMGDIVKIANDHFAVYDFNGLVDLNIRCREHVMAPYQELKTNR